MHYSNYRNNQAIGGPVIQNIIDETNDVLIRKRVRRHSDMGCGVILLDKNDNIILGTRTDLPEYVLQRIIETGEELKWTLAGGGMEYDESPLYCAIRELKEEFGIVAGKQTTHLQVIGYNDNYFMRNKQVRAKRDYTFITRLKDNTTIHDIIPQEGEIGETKAFTKDEILEMISEEKIYKASRMSLLMAMKMGYL
jgi:8-oxo-dGTP pyrophosphatase MutT (NUDIX family)